MLNSLKRTLIRIFIFGTFIVVLAGSLFSIDRALYYRERWFDCQAKLKAQGHSMVQDDLELHATETPRLILVGDSRFFRLSPPGKQTSYSIINKGVGGLTSDAMLPVFDKEVALLKPTAVVLQIGINDVLYKQGELGPADVKKNIKIVVEKCAALGIKPILTTVIPLGNKYLFQKMKLIGLKSKEFEAYNNQVTPLNTWIRGFAQENNYQLLDFAQSVRDGNNQINDEYFDGDGVHLSQNGDKLLWQSILGIDL